MLVMYVLRVLRASSCRRRATLWALLVLGRIISRLPVFKSLRCCGAAGRLFYDPAITLQYLNYIQMGLSQGRLCNCIFLVQMKGIDWLDVEIWLVTLVLRNVHTSFLEI